MTKLLLIEDDQELADQLSKWLSEQSYICEHAASGEDGLQLLSSYQYDLIILDWELPGKSGLEVCREFRKSGGLTPILFLTGQGDISNKESGLDSGADDYLTKPFEAREHAARIRSLLRRPNTIIVEELNVNGVTLDAKNRTVSFEGKSTRLMPTECATLEFLMRHPNQSFSTRALLDAVWASQSEASDESVRTCMKTLRFKLGKIDKKDLIKTVLGAGYSIEKMD
jgi:Response regulators consisting of a CheY-like receiver domain and a winged-helix DNA-binding domain